MSKDGISLIEGEVTPEEYASFWGADPCYDKPPRNRGDGYLFYNFAIEGYDPSFLEKFIPVIDRTIMTVLHDEHEQDELQKLKRICEERLEQATL